MELKTLELLCVALNGILITIKYIYVSKLAISLDKVLEKHLFSVKECYRDLIESRKVGFQSNSLLRKVFGHERECTAVNRVRR